MVTPTKHRFCHVMLAMIALVLCNPSASAAEPGGQTPTAGNTFLEALLGGQFKALIRYNGMYRNSGLHVLQDSSEPIPELEQKQQYSALGGYAGYETGQWLNLSAGGTVYTSQPFGNNPDERRGLGGLYEGDGGQDPYTVLGELFLRWQYRGHRLTAGRHEMPRYRMVSLSNIRMTPITHSGIVYDNSVLEGLSFSDGWIREMKGRNEKEFIDMVSGARLAESSNGKQLIRGPYNPGDFDETGYIGAEKEMAMAGAVFTRGHYTLEAWNYRVTDFVNSTYLYGDYTFETAGRFSYTLAAQYTLQKDIGSHVGGNIDTWHWGLRLGANSPALSWFIAYNQVAYNENSYDGGTLFVRWGSPQMFTSFQVQDGELAGEKSYGVGLQYDFGLNGRVRGLVMRCRYGYYDLPDDLLLTDARQDRREATLDLRYSLARDSGFGVFTEMKGLSLRFQLAWNNYRTDYDFEAYKAIHGYDFDRVTKDFYDARLYVEYLF